MKTTLEKSINIVCQYCVKCCCDDDCPVNATQHIMKILKCTLKNSILMNSK